MKILNTLFLFLLVPLFTQAQYRDLYPDSIYQLNFDKKKAAIYEQEVQRAAKIEAKLNAGTDFEALPVEDQHFLEIFDMTPDYWAAIDRGCSWYCGGGSKEVTASSTLNESGTTSYQASQAHDLNFKNAWVEGAKGEGVGEYLEYHFAAKSPRIHTIMFANGYVKSQKAWEENNRVKTLRVYVNNEKYCYLHLEDKRAVQVFKLPDMFGYSPIMKTQSGLPDWKVKFEIVEVYKGTKFNDTVISEIFFDGIDVH